MCFVIFFVKFRRTVIQKIEKLTTESPVFRWYRNIYVFHLLRLIRMKKIICRVRYYDSMFQIFNLRRTRSRYQLHFRRLHSLNPRQTFAPVSCQWSEHFTPIWTACGPTIRIQLITWLICPLKTRWRSNGGDNEIRLGRARIICTAAS